MTHITLDKGAGLWYSGGRIKEGEGHMDRTRTGCGTMAGFPMISWQPRKAVLTGDPIIPIGSRFMIIDGYGESLPDASLIHGFLAAEAEARAKAGEQGTPPC